MGIVRKLCSKVRSSLYVFKKAEIMQNIVNKEINGEYDNLCHSCYFNERYQQRARLEGMLEPENTLRLAIYLGGTMGDYIVYLRFVDEVSTICECSVDLFLDRMEFARFVYGRRENVTVVHDAENCLFHNSCTYYDMALHLDHGLTVRHCNLGAIREKAPLFYETACRIVEHAKATRIDIGNQHERESVILRRAKFYGNTKWSLLGCGGAVDMAEAYSNLLLDPAYFPVLKRYDLEGRKYITVNIGADKKMGGTAQTKVLPPQTIEAFIALFKSRYPDWLVVQTGVRDSLPLKGADRYAFDCRLEETAVILKNSACHVDSEGGLVHMASQMSTPCVVSFGPTPVHYYGYERNENIVAPACSDCMSVTGNWSRVCPRGMQAPACMQSITAEMILERVDKLDLNGVAAPRQEKTVDDWKALTGELKDGKVSRICFIGPLTERVSEAALALTREGDRVWLYIPPEMEADTVTLRTALKQRDVRVEYGDALNIAKADGAFDTVVCDRSGIAAEMSGYAEKECARLAAADGQIIWWKGSDRAACAV